MRLFICHASEDKSAFVRPLAEELRNHFDVWYDEYQLTLGDSLLQKINEGLAMCDFGVVVLSKAFFSKKWTQAELDGLFALEGQTRKIILPVRKDISPEEVTRFSPILGGRLSVSASAGVSKVVEEIKLAVDVSERKRQLTIFDSATQRFRMLDQSIKERQAVQTILQTETGATLVQQAFIALGSTLADTLSELSRTAEAVKFAIEHNTPSAFVARSGYGVHVSVVLRDVFLNTASHVSLNVRYYHYSRVSLLDDDNGPADLSTAAFTPSFRLPEEVIWVRKDEDTTLTTIELAGVIIEGLCRHIDERSKQR